MISTLVPEDWADYELMDTGEGEKLERFGQFVVSRPDPRAIWPKENPELWKNADANFLQIGEEERWKFRNSPPSPWNISYNNLRFALKATDFKHVGIFPEQAANWEWLSKVISKQLSANNLRGAKVLNLFGYTGAATLACARAGAQVTHVDSSRPAMMWAGENADLSRIDRKSIRWIQEDAAKFVKREARRESKYDGIIMDPPRFGRGASGEVWKIEKDLAPLIADCTNIISEMPIFFLLNAYTADLSSQAIANLMKAYFPEKEIENGELGLKETGSRGFVMPAGIWARWSV